MSDLEVTVRAFMARTEGLTRDELREALKGLPADQADVYYKLRKASYFVPANACLEKRREVLSPSGKYKLTITPYTTLHGGWSYTQGLVYAVGSDTPIAEIQRNYSAFPHLFVEGHSNGHDYLIGGEDYQGQTVIELDTGKRLDHLPKAASMGAGFCWASMTFDTTSKLLVVCGCIWAAPYEYRFYDFSDPMSGWPCLEPDDCVDEDVRPPVFLPDGTIQCFQTTYGSDSEDEDDETEEKEKPLRPVAATKIFRRDGLQLVLVNEWVSDAEKARRIAGEEARRKYDEWLANYKASDPLYLACLEGLKDPIFMQEQYIGIGITYEGWCPDFKGNEKRVCRRILEKKAGHTIDLEWAALTGPIKLVLYKDGSLVENKFFGHSVEDMRAAFAYAKAVVGGDTPCPA